MKETIKKETMPIHYRKLTKTKTSDSIPTKLIKVGILGKEEYNHLRQNTHKKILSKEESNTFRAF
jgi:hypothetical protein